ncbi:hypothetical protein E9993_07900 [Labilibacter sediminis]|nr:hypothetical protein E9993_07900 [Labilibacter sediminis]
MKISKVHIVSYLISLVLLVLIVFQIINKSGVNNNFTFALKEHTGKLNPKNGIVFGDERATTEVYMFGNYNCSYCRKFLNEDLSILLNKYKGKVKVVLMPVLTSNSQAEKDALSMAFAVSKYGKYKPYHNLMMQSRDVIYSSGFEDYLMEIMNHSEAIAEYFSGDEVEAVLSDNKKMFKQLELKGTPAFIMNDLIVNGYVSVEELEKLLNIY